VNKGIKPVMCMCYMTLALGAEKGEPNNYDEYKSTIKAFVQHYKDMGYTGWAWESHNEPEGFTNLTPQQTYKMYKYFADGVKDVDNTARVGGFGAVGPDWLGYINSFLTEYLNDISKPVLDFFSFHQYGKSSWEYVPVIEKAFTDKGLPIPELYITEWNSYWGNALGEGNGGLVGGGYDTEINASYVAKKIFDAIGCQNIKKIYYWNFADHDPNKKFAGGSGLFTVDGHWKASANTFLFYNKIHSQIVSSQFSGVGSEQHNFYGIATKSETDNKMAIILWNFQHIDVAVDIALNSLPVLPEGQFYKIEKYAIDNTNGNYYYDFLHGYSGEGIGPHEKVSVIDSFMVQANDVIHKDSIPAYGVIQYIIEPSSVITEILTCQKEQSDFINVYPTLFDDLINITYTSSKNENICISIFDINGQQIENIVPVSRKPGKHSLKFNGSFLKTGIYFVVYRSDTHMEAIKIFKR
ncbi:MAG: T9SS type A sorting domain-containing protein, partial [Bacteroidales bacterium]|nr:T9SS type A sorting domain-containing protein [Bacteroidales bacterium]